MQKVLLTGVTGFLGGHVTVALLNAGYQVRGSLRKRERIEATRQAIRTGGGDVRNLEFVELDLLKDEGWSEAMEGMDYLVHTASPFVTSMPKDKMQLITPAVQGTERAIGAAKASGVKRVVMTSSTVAIVSGRGKERPDTLGAEDWAEPDSGRMNAYAESKTLAERRAWELLPPEGDGPELVVINPGFIAGPLLDDDPGTSGALFQRFLRGQIPIAPNLFLHTVDVRDLADIHARALTDKKIVGTRNPAAFDAVSIKQASELLGESLPDFAKKMPKRSAPNWFIRAYSLFDRDVRANLNELGYNPHIDSEVTENLLGRPPRSARESFVDMCGSLIERGLV